MEDDSNLIKLNFPIHMMNIEGMKTTGKETVAIGIKIGNKKLWSGMHEITLNDVGAGPTGAVQPTFV